MKLLQRLIMEETGQGITEYALILGLVVFGIWLAITQTGIGPSISNLFNQVKGQVDACAGGGGNCNAASGT